MKYLSTIVIQVKCLNDNKSYSFYDLDDSDSIFGIYAFVETKMFQIYGTSAPYLTFDISIDYDYKLFKNRFVDYEREDLEIY